MFKNRKEKDTKKGRKEDVPGGRSSDYDTEKRKSHEQKKPADSEEAREVEPDSEEERKRREEERKKREEEDRKRKREEEKRKEEAKQKREEERRKKKELADRKKQEEERRRAEEAEDDDGEVQELEAIPYESTGGVGYKEMYKHFPYTDHPEVFASYDKLQTFARELNTQVAAPEIVVIGHQGHGKSSIIEGILGHHVTFTGYGATKRPLFLNLINNPKCDRPRVTLKRDPLLKGPEYDHDVVVALSDLPEELQKRNKLNKLSEEPVFLQYEYRYCSNLTLIDTPGLLKEEDADATGEVQAMINNLVKHPDRFILCVEEAKDWDKLDMMDFIKKFDPEFSRTTFVYTKLHFHLQRFTSARQVNRYLQGTIPDAHCFFTTMLPSRVRARYADPEKFQEKIYQCTRRDIKALEQLQYDRRHESNIGAVQLRQYLLNLAWKRYQDDIPQILKRLRANKAENELRLRKVQAQLEGLNSVKLRSIASDYVVNFLQAVDKLLAGTSEGNPAVNGQTLDEEKQHLGDGDWVDSHNKLIKVESEDWGIPYWESRLYGGQQFERLLAEFKAVADHQKLPEVSMDDIATAAGINKLNNIPNYAWAASDLAQQSAREELAPLIDQAVKRATYILRRLPDIVDKMLDARRRGRLEGGWAPAAGSVDVNNIDMYPFFTYHVKDLYNKFVERTATALASKAMDEFYGTRTIFWEYTEYADTKLPMDRSDADETRRAVDSLAKELFTRLRERITKNVLLKFYNFLLVPMQAELWTEIQGAVTTLSDDQLEQIFEVAATKNKLKEDEKALSRGIEAYATQEVHFIKSATQFSHPIYVLSQGNQ